MIKLLLYLCIVLCTTSTIWTQDKNEQMREDRAIIHTSKGSITCHLYLEEAPLSVALFVQLAKEGFYNGLTFYRIVPKYVVEAGDPDGHDFGVSAELNQLHQKGALAWHRLPDYQNPEKRSSGSQFYITLDTLSNLDRKYSVFGQTIEGMDVLDRLEEGDVIKGIEVLCSTKKQ